MRKVRDAKKEKKKETGKTMMAEKIGNINTTMEEILEIAKQYFDRIGTIELYIHTSCKRSVARRVIVSLTPEAVEKAQYNSCCFCL